MRFKNLAIATFVVPVCLSTAVARAESSTTLRINPTVTDCTNCQSAIAVQSVPVAADRADWQRFSSSTGGFSILMPGTPTQQTQSDKAEDGGTYEHHFFTVTRPDGGYLVSYTDFSEDLVTQLGTDAALDAAIQGMTEEGAQVLSQRDITLAGYPGRAIEARDSKGSTYNTQIFLVKGRLYFLAAMTPNVGDVERFFNSFNLIP